MKSKNHDKNQIYGESGGIKAYDHCHIDHQMHPSSNDCYEVIPATQAVISCLRSVNRTVVPCSTHNGTSCGYTIGMPSILSMPRSSHCPRLARMERAMGMSIWAEKESFARVSSRVSPFRPSNSALVSVSAKIVKLRRRGHTALSTSSVSMMCHFAGEYCSPPGTNRKESVIVSKVCRAGDDFRRARTPRRDLGPSPWSL